MKVVQYGLPTIVEAESTETGKALAEAVLVPETPARSFAGLVTALLAGFSEAATIIIDPISRSVWAASGAEGAALQAAAIAALDGDEASAITADPGQEGKSLTFTETNPVAPEDVEAKIALAIEAQKPRRTIASIVSQILTGDVVKAPVIIVDQAAGAVYVNVEDPLAPIEGVLDGVANAGDRVKVTLPEIESPAVEAGLIFEGGATAP